MHDGYIALNGKITANGLPSDVDTLGLQQESDDTKESAGLGGYVHENVTVEIDRPKAALPILMVEVLCLLAEIGISLAILSVNTLRDNWYRAEWATLLTWIYVLILAALRFYFQLTRINPLPQLWVHTATLYSSLWILAVVLFRSTIISPEPQPTQSLRIASFALITTLVVIAYSTRKGNRAVLMAHEGDIEPSREPLASLFSDVTFSWMDLLILRGWRKTLELADVWNVLPREKAMVVLTSFRHYQKTTNLAFHLIKFFKYDLLYQQFWAFLSGITTFVPTLLLKAILEYVEDPDSTTKTTAWLWVILLFLIACFNGVADAQALWRGRKICIKLRTIMIGEIYAKTLRRRTASSGDTDMNKSTSEPSQNDQSRIARLWNWLHGRKRTPERHEDEDEGAQAKAKEDSTQVNSGTIINLMSVDSFSVSEISAYWHFLIPSVPVQLVVAITLLFRILGWSAFAGIGVMIAVLPINMFFANRFSYAHKRIMAATDSRIHTTNEVLQNVRIIKFFAWEDRFASKIDEKRRIELAAIRYRMILWALATVVWFGVPIVITAVSFFLYTVVEHKPLVPSVAFTALSLFSLLRIPLDRLADMVAHVLESRVSIARVEKFLDEEETGKYQQLQPHEDESLETFIGFKNATFSWGSADEAFDKKDRAFRMINLSVDFRVGGLNIIAGPTGSGKTSLLMALLGEMTLISGRVQLPGGYERARLQARPDGLTESVAYCAQQAWLVNDTIKQNILFSSPYDEQRYQAVLEACALKRDLEVFESGDATLVGEKGVVVSGGQKQRISLARALYSNSRHILLDDCLSAVDSHTAQHIFDHCITGPLMMNRTCILVTHNIALCVPHAHHVVVLSNGKIVGQGTPQHVMSSGLLGDDGKDSRGGTRPGTATDSRPPSVKGADKKTANGTTGNGANETDLKKQHEDVQDANLRTEEKAVGSVDWRVIALYFKSMGPWYLWTAVLLAYILENLANVATGVWIRQWANSYPTSETIAVSTEHNSTEFASQLATWAGSTRTMFFVATRVAADGIGVTTVPAPDSVNISYYLTIYVALGVLYIVLALLRLGFLFKGALNASRRLHAELLNCVLRAKFKFFDTTPLGQIMNRFSKDLQSIDQDIAPVAAGLLQTLFGIVVIVILISAITPAFLFAGVLLTVLYAAIGAFYVQSSRDLKRLESQQRSPLYQQFGETLSGVTTIRAYGDERRFIVDNSKRIDKYNRPFIFLWGANRWLALRVDFAGALVSFFAALFILLKVGTIDAGAAGLSLTYALSFNENILWLVRLYAQNEQNMNHVERIKDFLEVEQEAPAQILATQPAGDWPSKGAIRFENYSTRYRSDLEPVLRNLTLDIKAEEKVGIVGRTGAGKSSLAMALFRGLEADAGRIIIDGVDINTIGLQDLRENLTIVPQDPTLFTGTLRSNLDPFGLFTDEQIFAVLRRVHLIGPDASLVATEAPIDEPPAAAVPIDADMAPVDEPEMSNPVTDVLAPASLRRPSVSAAGVTGEESSTTGALAKVLTNSQDNANVFLNLDSTVSESGGNLSQGQRQLLCLARALLKSPRVLVMDEATASIDYATDAKIQDTLREIRGSTIITIAHRLQTIVDYDKVLVLEKGEVVEFGPPWELIAREAGLFRGMCESSGDFELLRAAAGNAERRSQLVDIAE